MREYIKDLLEKSIGVREIHLEVPEIEGHGDYSTNIALKLKTQNSKLKTKTSKLKLGDNKTARDLAGAIVKELKKDKKLSKIVDKIEVAGPGFINFRLSKPYLLESLQEVLKKADQYGSNSIAKGQTALVEYSAPNIARRFSIGHLRSTIIGQALYNTFKFAGYKTIGENHIGDWGTQFGMIIAAIVKKDLDPSKLSVEDYQKLYVEYNKACQDDPSMRDDAKAWFKKLEDGDKEARNVWKSAINNSLKEFDRIYEMLGVKIDNAHGESFYEDKMPAVINELRKEGLTKKSEGAEIIEFKGMVPGILLKSDGGTTYFTRDLAALKYRLDTWSPEILIYEVGVEQQLHFKQVFAAVRKVGWVKDEELVHVPHGHYRFKGKKISTRKGVEVILEDILDEAVKRARKILDKTKTAKDLSASEKENISKAVGIGAIKYFDLSHRPTTQIDFDWESMFNMQGNSGPYLQYTAARANSVLQRAEFPISNFQFPNKFQISKYRFNKEELALMRTFPRFSEVIVDVTKSYSPNLLCNYLFDLAQKYNAFYNSYRILNPKAKGQKGKRVKEFRIALTAATGQILKNGLTLLGTQAPDKM